MDHDDHVAHGRATAGLPHPNAVHSWQSNTPGYSDVVLDPGAYRFEGTASVGVQVIVERTLADAENPPHVVLAPATGFTGGDLVITETAEFRITRGPGNLNLILVNPS